MTVRCVLHATSLVKIDHAGKGNVVMVIHYLLSWCSYSVEFGGTDFGAHLPNDILSDNTQRKQLTVLSVKLNKSLPIS